MTLDVFMKLPFTQEFCLLNNISNINTILVEHINILEPPVENFVRSNEIVLSTALSVRDTPTELYNFIYEVYSAGAAAIIFAFPNDDFTQLEALLPKFEALHFPIISMPWSHRFSEVVENTMREIWVKDEENQSYLESMQHELLNYFINGKTLDDAAELLYKYLASDILIYDANDTLKGKNRNLRNLTPEQLNRELPASLSRVEIASSGHLYGYVLADTNTLAVTLYSSEAKRYLNTPLTLWFDREWSITASKMKSKEDFVWNLAHQEFTSSQDAFSKAELLGFKTDTKYACFVADIYTHRISAKGNDSYAASYIFQSSSTIIEEQVLQTAHEMELSAMTALHKQRLIIFLETTDNAITSSLANEYLDRFESNIQNYVPSIGFFWGYDNQGRSIDSIYISYKNAKSALKLCQNSHGSINRNCFQLSIIQKVLSLLCTDNEIVSMAKGILKELIDYDESKKTNYLETLTTYIHTNYNISETARLLHLHRQSLLYRLDKISELCQLPLKKHENLLVLEICIMIVNNHKHY